MSSSVDNVEDDNQHLPNVPRTSSPRSNPRFIKCCGCSAELQSSSSIHHHHSRHSNHTEDLTTTPSSNGASIRTSNSSHQNQINLRLILVSGKTKDFMFSPNDSAADVARYVFDHWPEEWADESVSRAEILRLIYQGRFLHGNVILAALQLPLGRTSVMHLVPRENLPEPNSQDQRQKSKERSNGCCNIKCCVI
ncbi:ubiquitin like 3 [Brevipalpus obovatus]|uniref:ubiquitin like 3 n=1 Tax=Brevipalpus obovatus TaxID=246614 RepID=UPI003D9DE733